MAEEENGERITERESGSEVIYRGWKVMPLIIGNETIEKVGIDGAVSNLLIYLTTVFNMRKINATTTINIFKGTTHLGTLVGAFLCDSYFGRYKTLGFSIIACFLGLLAIQLTASISELHPPHCGAKTPNLCKKATPGQLAFLFTGFGLLITGSGGIKPCNLAFGVDQFNPNSKSGKQGSASFFNWYFFTYTFAQLVSLTLIVYVQSNVSWSIGLAIPVGLMLIACVMFFAGSKLYVKVKASGSPLMSILQVAVVAIKKRRLALPSPELPWRSLHRYIPPKSINSELPYTNQFRFLDKAAILTPKDEVNPDGSPVDPWRLCSLQQVEEVKCVLRVLPIWVSAIFFHLSIVQQNTYAIFQAVQMDRRLGHTDFKIPASTYVVFLMLSSTVSVPIYDRILVPVLRRITGKQQGITLLQRMGIGIFISPTTMIVSGIIEHRRRTIALTRPALGIAGKKGEISSMSALWLIPQLSLAGLSEVFSAIGQMEFYYKQFPENMRSVAGSLFYCGLAGSSYLNSFLISLVNRATTTKGAPAAGDWLPEDLNKGRLDFFYYMIAGLGFVNCGYFLMCASWYKYKGGDADGYGETKDDDYKNLA